MSGPVWSSANVAPRKLSSLARSVTRTWVLAELGHPQIQNRPTDWNSWRCCRLSKRAAAPPGRHIPPRTAPASICPRWGRFFGNREWPLLIL
jgi:hypothetical protein